MKQMGRRRKIKKKLVKTSTKQMMMIKHNLWAKIFRKIINLHQTKVKTMECRPKKKRQQKEKKQRRKGKKDWKKRRRKNWKKKRRNRGEKKRRRSSSLKISKCAIILQKEKIKKKELRIIRTSTTLPKQKAKKINRMKRKLIWMKAVKWVWMERLDYKI